MSGSTSDTPFIEYFGGSNAEGFDNKTAILSAISQGYPVRFGPWTYYVSGLTTISEGAVFLGIAGETTVKRLSQSGASWLDFTGSSVYLDGIIFDGNASNTVSSRGVVIDTTVTSSVIQNCQFINNKVSNASVENGLIYLSSGATATVNHQLNNCVLANNGFHGVSVEIVNNVLINNCISYSNHMNGFHVDGDINNTTPNKNVTISNCTAYSNNNNGIQVCSVTNGSLGYYSNSAPATIGALITDNVSYSNGAYGIYVGTLQNGIIQNNVVYNHNYGNILAECSIYTKVINNQIYGTGTIGIAADGGNRVCVDDNLVTGGTGSQIGVSVGAGTMTSCSRNKVSGYAAYGILVENIQGDGNNNGFGTLDTYTVLSENIIDYTNGAYGISITDNPTSVIVENNRFFKSTDTNGLNAVRDVSISTTYSDNSINNNTIPTVTISASGTLKVPEWVQTLNIEPSASGLSISQISTTTQVNIGSGVAYVIVTAGGSSYTTPTGFSFSGGTGSGAAYTAFPWDGKVSGIRMSGNGTGYGSLGSTFPLTITNSVSGSGAAATAYVGLPWRTNRIIKINNLSTNSIEIMGTSMSANSTMELVFNGTAWTVLQ